VHPPTSAPVGIYVNRLDRATKYMDSTQKI